jgi:hypothetical protein
VRKTGLLVLMLLVFIQLVEALETQCNDGVDNDADFLIDTADPDCGGDCDSNVVPSEDCGGTAFIGSQCTANGEPGLCVQPSGTSCLTCSGSCNEEFFADVPNQIFQVFCVGCTPRLPAW